MPVAQGKAHEGGHHDPNAVFRINVGLAVRDSAGLDQVIREASAPGNSQSGRYLTNAQYMATYAPTDAQAQALSSWLTGQGLDVTGVSPDNLLVHVQGKVGDVERAFGVTINDYSYQGRSFHANSADPVVPDTLSVSWVSGLSNYDRFTTSPAVTDGWLDGGDFRKAYNVSGSGAGLSIGFALWGESLPQSEYDGYAAATGTTKLTIGQAGDDGLDFIPIGGTTTESDTDSEVALDTQVAHAMAPGVHETFWLGHDNSTPTLESVENAAANSTVSIISNSWGCGGCPDPIMDAQFQHGAAVGKTFVFASGDYGASGQGGPSSEALSPYVLAVGGTNLILDGSSNYVSEAGWDGSGGGCDNRVPRPFWQVGVSAALVYPSAACRGRTEPDVAADSSTCAFVFVFGVNGCYIGTSLSAPLWGAMLTLWNGNNATHQRPSIGFVPPLIYALANDPTTYPLDFHDITSGSNDFPTGIGFSAGTGWDEVTGWGSPIFESLSNNVADVTYTGPTQVVQGDTITLQATLLDHNAPTTLATAALGAPKVSLAAAGSSCHANVSHSGSASCTVTITDPPGTYAATAAYAGDAAYVGGSDSKTFTVLQIPTKVTYSGTTSGDYNDPVTLSAKLTDNRDGTSSLSGAPIPRETLNFTLGGEHCSGVTDSSGVASCTITPLDAPGSYSVGVSFAGDEPLHESSDSSTPFTVNQEESTLSYTGALTVHYHDQATLSASLTDPDGGAPIAAKTVTFALSGGDHCSGTTDSTGNASCTLTPQSSGSQTLKVSFADDADYLPSAASTSFTVTPEETTVTYTGPTVILATGSSATLTAKLVEEGANDNDGDGGSSPPIPAETVTLSLGSQNCTGTTNSAGNVSCAISVSVPLGPEAVGASFAGDAFYQAASVRATAIVFAFPSTGVFTLGDLTASAALPPSTATVTWWNNNWYLLNSLSGGTAPSAFKGFAGAVTLPTTTPAGFCTHNATSGGGNSPPPPSTVPSYMGVIVSKKITKTGSNISDAYIKIVVVKTNPGYASGPNNAGTGTIVATFCG